MSSGKSQTSAQRRARGLHRLEVWLPVAYIRKLDQLCDESGWSRAEQIEAQIDWETAELDGIRLRGKRRKLKPAKVEEK